MSQPDSTVIMEEIRRLKAEVESGPVRAKASYHAKAYDAILNLHERLTALEAAASKR